MADLRDYHIRDAGPEDLAGIRELTLSAYAEYASTMEPTAWAGLEQAVYSGLASEEPVERLVAERAGRLIGSVMLYPPQANAYGGAHIQASWPELRLLAVSAESRGRGVGEALVRACVQRARELGATELGLHTSRSMRAAMQMYRKMGFVRAPEHDFQPEGAERVEGYRLRLPPL